MKLSPAAKKAKAAYQREWARRNPEKQREFMRRFWERKGAELSGVTDTPTVSVTNCEMCGKPFAPKRNTAKFCSDLCRVRHSRSNLESI